jgi:hypothetical protein
VDDSDHQSVGDVSELYLGNILYALERTAMTLESEGKTEDAGFYRGIARRLAEARGRVLREKSARPPGVGQEGVR